MENEQVAYALQVLDTLQKQFYSLYSKLADKDVEGVDPRVPLMGAVLNAVQATIEVNEKYLNHVMELSEDEMQEILLHIGIDDDERQ